MKKVFLMVILILTMVFLFTGCMKPYDKPELVTISPSQTAFLIPLQGETSSQKEFMSEKFLQDSKVATKEIQIPHRWLQEGRMSNNGKYIPSATLIIVERKPETREWTENQSTGTSSKNEGIVAESKESIGFMARMNCSAQIDEVDAVKFLYRYNNKTLAEIMDTEIRAKIESAFVEQCSKYTLEEILLNKEKIMTDVRQPVISYFSERGITITVIGMKGEFTYLNKDIQEAIDNKFKTAQALITQKDENERILSKAKADAEAVRIQSESIEKSIKLKELENQSKAIDKWNGQPPSYMTNGENTIFSMPFNK